jgi:uncharacterized repeat protein (TIGR04138 family)
MSDKNFPEVVKEIHQKDGRYAKGAYFFIREALDHTLKSLEKDTKKNKGHVSGEELLEGIRAFALDKFGPMTLTLMNHWNIRKCRDFGNIVFNLVEFGILGRTDNDSLEDFDGGYNFQEAFETPFLPSDGNSGDLARN